MSQLTEYIKDQIWILEYPVRFGGKSKRGRRDLILTICCNQEVRTLELF